MINEPCSLVNDLLSPSEVVEVYQLQGFELMMGKLPFMSTNDQINPFLSIIIVEHGEKLLNMGQDLSLVIDFDCVFLPDCVWRCLGLFLWDPMAPRVGRAKDYVVRKTRETLDVEEATTHYQNLIPPITKEAMHPLEDKVKLVQSYQEDAGVYEKVGEIVPDLGYTRNRDIKFHHIVELYWHAKTMVA
jgi:hypothetical protein